VTGPLPGGGPSGPYHDDLRVLLAAHGADHEPDRARIRARLDAGLADARRADAGRTARLWPRPPLRMAALVAASVVAAAAVLVAVIDTGRPVQVSTTGPASGASAGGGADNRNRGPAADGDIDAPAAAAPPSVPEGGPDPTADGQLVVAGTDVPGIRVPADDPDPVASTTVTATAETSAGTGAGAGSGTGVVGGSDRAGPGDGAGGGPNGLSPGPSTPAGGGGDDPGGNGVSGGAPPSVTVLAESTTRPTTATTAAPTTARPTTAPALGGLAVKTGLLPQSLQLGPTGYLDWVVVGSRSDGKPVRMKAGTGRLTVSAPSGALSTPGLIPILWSGGNPEQDRTDNTRWWTAEASSSSFVVQVAGADDASEIVLYAGSSSSLTVTVTVSSRGTSQKTVSAGFFGSAAKITVSLSGADRGKDVTITLGAARGTVSLGAVTER